MVILITGATHTGKTLLAQKMIEKYGFSCLSIDHLKMGLIRCGQTELTPMDDEALTPYLWPILREMIKTVIENKQNLIMEGCYIPFDWQKDFEKVYLDEIRSICLVMSRRYIEAHFADIKYHANVIEKRLEDEGLTAQALIKDNEANLAGCKAHHLPYWLMDEAYCLPTEQI